VPWQRWDRLASPDFATLDPRATLVLQPVAAIEQHGPHLPVGTDAAICRAIVDAALARLEGPGLVLRLPMLAVGVSGEHLGFAGTLSLEPETAIAVLTEIGRSVASAGLQRLMIFNTHGGQPQIVDIVAQRLRREAGLLVARVNAFHFDLPRDWLPEHERRFGLHGGLVETALMLAIAPDLVRSDRRRRFLSWAEDVEAGCRRLRVEAGDGIGWLARDLNPAGVVGDAAAATVELGQAILERYVGQLAALIADTLRLPWPPTPAAG
jgi:creatinine amidohydrolase